MYVQRTIEKAIINVSKSFPCIAIYGPRQVGKSTTVHQLFKDSFGYVSLDNLDDRAVATAKTIPANIGQAGQIGSLHGGAIRAYSRVNTGDGGYYLDDWAIYDTALTAREIGRLRLRLLAVPLVFRVR